MVPCRHGLHVRTSAGAVADNQPFPAGCAYWKHASEGHRFYTLAEDHYNCTVGAFTHGVTLPPAKAHELTSIVGTMIQLQYLGDDEVATIPHRSEPFSVAAYARSATPRFPRTSSSFAATPVS